MDRMLFIFVVILSRSSQYNLYDVVPWTKIYLILMLAKCKGYIFDKRSHERGNQIGKGINIYLDWNILKLTNKTKTNYFANVDVVVFLRCDFFE